MDSPSVRLQAIEAQMSSLAQENEYLRRQLKASKALATKQEEELKTRERDARAFHLKFARTSADLMKLRQDYALLEGDSVAGLLKANSELQAKNTAQKLDYERLKKSEGSPYIENERSKLLARIQTLEQMVAAKDRRISDLEIKTRQRLEDMQLVVQRVQANESVLLQSNKEFQEEITRLKIQLEQKVQQVESASADIRLFQEAMRHKEDEIREVKTILREREVLCGKLQTDLHDLQLVIRASKETERRPESTVEPRSLLAL